MDWNIQDHKALGFSQGIIQRFPYLGIKMLSILSLGPLKDQRNRKD